MKKQLLLIMLAAGMLSLGVLAQGAESSMLGVMESQGADIVTRAGRGETGERSDRWQEDSEVRRLGEDYLQRYLRRSCGQSGQGIRMSISGVRSEVQEFHTYGHTSYQIEYTLTGMARRNGQIIWSGEVKEVVRNLTGEQAITEDIRLKLVKRAVNAVVRQVTLSVPRAGGGQ